MTVAFVPVRPPPYAVPLTACDYVATTVENGASTITGVTRIRGDGPYLVDHFPQVTIFPGVFLLEALVQAVGEALGERDGHPLRLREVRSMRLLVPLYPGDQLRIAARTVDSPAGDGVVVTADCRRGDGMRVATMAVESGWSA